MDESSAYLGLTLQKFFCAAFTAVVSKPEEGYVWVCVFVCVCAHALRAQM